MRERSNDPVVAEENTIVDSATRPRASSSPLTVLDAVIMVALVVAGVVVSLIRVPIGHHDIVWAEDGNIFLFEAVNRGAWNVLFEGYAGYQHLIPRIFAGITLTFFPLSSYAVVVFVSVCVLIGLVAAAVFWLSRDVVPWIPARIVLASITFILPLAMQEVIGNLADFHTYCLWLAPWVLMARHRSWIGGWSWGLLAFLGTMTEIQSVIFLALVPFVLRRNNKYLWPTIGAMSIGAIWQISTVLTVERDADSSLIGPFSIIQGWLINTVMPMINANPDWIRATLQNDGFTTALVVVVPFVAAGLFVLVKGTPRQRLLVCALALASAAIYAGGAIVDGSWFFRYAELATGAPWTRVINVRYGVASGMMLAAIIPLAAQVGRQRAAGSMGAGKRGAHKGVSMGLAWVLLAALVAVFSVSSSQAVSIRGWVDGQWSSAVDSALVSCGADGLGSASVKLPVAPERSVSLTCEQIQQLSPSE